MSEPKKTPPTSTPDQPSPPRTGSGKGKWLALTAALLGWMFDGVEIGLFPLVARPSLQDLLGPDLGSEGQIGVWIGVITAAFLVGAATGGVVFGWLGDRIGRVRAMTLSVLTYSIFTGLCGVADSATQVAVFRFIAALGMGGEWSLGVALVMEVWPNRSRALMAGLIGAAANVGFLLIAFVGLWLAAPDSLNTIAGWLGSIGLSQDRVDWLTGHSGWRLLMFLGAGPAFLTFFIRIFVPESESWEHQHKTGQTSNWATRDLLGVVVGALAGAFIIYLWGTTHTGSIEHTTGLRVIGTLIGLVVSLGGYIYPVLRFLQRTQTAALAKGDTTQSWAPVIRRMLLAAALSGVALIGTWGSLQLATPWADQLAEQIPLAERPNAKAFTQIWSGFGAIIGCILGALMGDWFGRRITYTLLCITSLASSWALFQFNTEFNGMFLFWAFIAGTTTASFYGWLPLYLPELFRTNVRATGQGFGFNFGRILAAIGVLQTGNLIMSFSKADNFFVETAKSIGLPNVGGYPLACSVICVVYLVGIVLIWFAPETRGKDLPE